MIGRRCHRVTFWLWLACESADCMPRLYTTYCSPPARAVKKQQIEVSHRSSRGRWWLLVAAAAAACSQAGDERQRTAALQKNHRGFDDGPKSEIVHSAPPRASLRQPPVKTQIRRTRLFRLQPSSTAAEKTTHHRRLNTFVCSVQFTVPSEQDSSQRLAIKVPRSYGQPPPKLHYTRL
jgi:hypothetical protein